jgi:homocysteine S-methyltransferase
MPPKLALPPLILLDGGLGTTLADRYNCVFDERTPLWSSHLLLSEAGRATLSSVQRSFARCGADVLLSATYQASYEGFARSGVREEKEAARLMRGAVGIARESFEGEMGGKVALGLGAYGATMSPGQEYSGSYDSARDGVDGLREWHLRRMGAFMPGFGEEGEEKEREVCWESIDSVAFETLPRVDEVVAVREVMEKVNGLVRGREKRFWISCVFPGKGNVLPDGSSVGQVVHAMLGEGKGARPMGVGINCTRVGKVEGLVVEFERKTGEMIERGEIEGKWPSLVLYPDGTRGEVYNTTTKEWVKTGDVEESLVSFALSAMADSSVVSTDKE